MSKTLAHYTVHEQLGAGGMGVVHRAHDSRLGRDVALKLLPAALFADEDARARLVQEARLASSLNHPNISTIYEVGEAENQTYIAMELVRGRPLREQIPPGGLPVETALRYGAQIADALAHAHEHGIIHRDLKSANVVIAPDGRAKVLDFGLAKRVAAGPGDETQSVQAALTETGAVLGTPHSSSPEALRGEPATERSDIWSLGVLLYEMVTGALPFAGRTAYEVCASILKEPAAPLPSRVPAGLRALIQRCLEKEPAQRLQHAIEVRAALEIIQSDLRAPEAPPFSPPVSSQRRWVRRAAAFLLLGGLVAGGLWIAARRPGPALELQQRQLTSNPDIRYGTLSPDGKTLAVIDGHGLSLRAIDSGESHPLQFPEGFGVGGSVFPVLDWFPDGSQLLVTCRAADGKSSVCIVPVLGGRARKLLGNASCATISRDGSHIAYMHLGEHGAELWCAGPNGESPRRVAASDTTGGIYSWAAWSPSGQRLAYSRALMGPKGGSVYIESCDLDGNRRLAFEETSEQKLHVYTRPVWLADGRMVFGLSDPPPSQADLNLWSLHVDPRSGTPSGSPTRITQWQRLRLVVPTGVSADGKRLTMVVASYQSDCYFGRIAGGDSLLQSVTRLTLDDRFDLNPNWMPDSKAILFESDRNGTVDIFKQALDASQAAPLVTGPGNQRGPMVTPDGGWILYLDTAGGTNTPLHGPEQGGRLMRLPIGGGPPEKVFDTPPVFAWACARGPGTRCVLSEIDQGQTVFTEFDPLRGRGRELVRVAGIQPLWDLSADGAALVVTAPDDSLPRIRVISLPSGESHEVRLDRHMGIQSITWTADGRGWFAIDCLDLRAWNFRKIDLQGVTKPQLPTQPWMYSAAASPDGRKVAFTSNTVEGSVWLVENF